MCPGTEDSEHRRLDRSRHYQNVRIWSCRRLEPVTAGLEVDDAPVSDIDPVQRAVLAAVPALRLGVPVDHGADGADVAGPDPRDAELELHGLEAGDAADGANDGPDQGGLPEEAGAVGLPVTVRDGLAGLVEEDGLAAVGGCAEVRAGPDDRVVGDDHDAELVGGGARALAGLDPVDFGAALAGGAGGC